MLEIIFTIYLLLGIGYWLTILVIRIFGLIIYSKALWLVFTPILPIHYLFVLGNKKLLKSPESFAITIVATALLILVLNLYI